MEILREIEHQVPSGYWYKPVKRKVGRCDNCGQEVELLFHTNRCSCGQRYNLYGQPVMKSCLG